MALRMSHAVLYVHDLEAMVDFYTRVLGFEMTDRGELGPDATGIVFLSQVPEEHHQLALLRRTASAGREATIDHLAFRVESLAELRAVADRVRGDGRVTEIAPLTHGNAWSFYFRDPEGNGLEVFCDTPWHVSQPQLRGWDPALDDEALHAWTRNSFEGERGFGPLEAYQRARASSGKR